MREIRCSDGGAAQAAAGRPAGTESAATEVGAQHASDDEISTAVLSGGGATAILPQDDGYSEVLATGDGRVCGAVPDGPGPRPAVRAPVTRQAAAEIGMYLGAALALVALGGSVVRGWSDVGSVTRGVFVALAAAALLALGLVVRLPWTRVPTDRGRRASSSLLTAGAAVALGGLGGVLAVAERSADTGPQLAVACVAAGLALLVVNVVARTPLSETGLLATLVWSGWVLTPSGPGTWAVLTGLGVAWAALGFRFARGRRTAGTLGAALALAAGVGLAAGPWAWPARAGLAAAAVFGLGSFLRGGANHWLALGAGASTALAASAAGRVVGPAVALLAGGVATMAVSWIALRTAGSR